MSQLSTIMSRKEENVESVQVFLGWRLNLSHRVFIASGTTKTICSGGNVDAEFTILRIKFHGTKFHELFAKRGTIHTLTPLFATLLMQ